MRTPRTNVILSLLLMSLAAISGCKKSSSSGEEPAPDTSKDNTGLPGQGSVDGKGKQNPGPGEGGSQQGGGQQGGGQQGGGTVDGGTGEGGSGQGGTGQGGGSTSGTGTGGVATDPNQYKKFPDDFPDAGTKQAQEIFVPARLPESLMMQTVTPSAWFESTDGQTLCHIGAKRTFWTTKVPAVQWPRNDEAYLSVTTDNDFFSDIYKWYDSSRKEYISVGREGMSAINPCPLPKGPMFVHVYKKDFIPLTNPAAFTYLHANYTIQMLMVTEETYLGSVYSKTNLQAQKGSRGCLIPANHAFAVVFKVGAGAADAGSIPVELVGDVGGSGELCKSGSMGYLPAATTLRML